MDLSSKTLLLLVKFYVGSYMLLLEILTSTLQTDYDTLLFKIGLLHFGIIFYHPLQINLEMSQIIMGLPIELSILLLQILSFPSKFFYLIQLIRHILVFLLDLIQLSLDYDQLFVMILQSSLHCF